MKLSLLLYMISFGIRLTGIVYPSFKEKLKEKDYTGVIRTKDGSVCRYYQFEGGKFTSKAKNYINASFTMNWSDAEYAFNVLSSGSKLKFMNAIGSGKLKVDGDPALAIVFLESLEEMGNLYKKKGGAQKTA